MSPTDEFFISIFIKSVQGKFHISPRVNIWNVSVHIFSGILCKGVLRENLSAKDWMEVDFMSG